MNSEIKLFIEFTLNIKQVDYHIVNLFLKVCYRQLQAFKFIDFIKKKLLLALNFTNMTNFLHFSKKAFLHLAFLFLLPVIGNSQLLITEIMYNPPESGTDSLEYIEVYNAGPAAVDMNGFNLIFANAVRYTFSSPYSLSPNSVVVFAVNAGAVMRNFDLTFMPFQWNSSGLSNSGTTVVLRDLDNDTLDLVTYANSWISGANALGASINFCPSIANNNISSNWFASQDSTGNIINSQELIGSPGVIECLSPSIYNVTGGGEFCAGGTGLSIGLSNSEIGVSYQLKRNGNDIGTPINGTGLAIDFGLQTSGGTYTVIGTLSGQDEAMNGTVTITVSPLAGNGTTQAACGSYAWNGTTYTSSGIYTHSNSLCDVDTLYLTITPNASEVFNQFACGSFFWNGTTYTASGSYTYSNGVCDVDTLNLFLTPIVGFGTTQAACGSYSWNGTNYTASGTYIYANSPCDIDTLYLTITPITGISTTQAACDSFSWNGSNYTASGTYTHNNSVCDVDTLYLTISPTIGNSTTQTACGTFTWNGTDYTTSGTYTHANSTCDVDTLFLTITTIDTTITIGSNVLTANQSNANYQWYECASNSTIAGATNQEFNPLVTGFYYVVIEKNSCVDSSSCVEIMLWGLDELDETVLQIAPNPARDFIQFTTDELLEFTKIELLDFTGKTVLNCSAAEVKEQTINVSSLTTGVYLIRFSTDLQQITKKVIIE